MLRNFQVKIELDGTWVSKARALFNLALIVEFSNYLLCHVNLSLLNPKST